MPKTIEKVPDQLPSEITSLSSMFNQTLNFNKNISLWNTATITNMSFMFYGTTLFNGDIFSWNTANVTDMSGMFVNARVFNQDLSSWNVDKVSDHSDFATNSGITDDNKLPKFPEQFFRFCFKDNKENLIDLSYWKETRNNSFIHTFEFSKAQGIPSEFKYIHFVNNDNSKNIGDSSYSWGATGYRTDKNLNNVIQNYDLTKYLRNIKVTQTGVNNPWNSCTITICDDTQSYLLASLQVTIKLGLTFYEENGKWFFQIIVTHYGETWGSVSGGQIQTPFGNSFTLSK